MTHVMKRRRKVVWLRRDLTHALGGTGPSGGAIESAGMKFMVRDSPDVIVKSGSITPRGI